MTAAAQSWRTTRALALAAAAALAAAQPAPPARAQALPPPGQPVPVPPNGSGNPTGSGPAAPVDVGQLVQANFQQDAQALQAGRTQAEREDAARRLVARQSPDGRREIVAALGVRPPPAPPPGQPTPLSTPLAAALAVPDDPLPPREYVPLLAVLLRTAPDYRHTEAAAAALVAIRTQPAVDALRAFVSDPNLPSRLPAVRPMGTSPDLRLAEVLVNLADPPAAVAARVDPSLRNAAADALAEMTQSPEVGRDPRAWRRWWDENRQRNPDQFRAELLERLRRRRPGAGLSDLDPLVTRLYQLAPAGDARAAAVRRVLDSADAPSRVAGARLVSAEYAATGRLPDPMAAPGSTLARLREMVRDPSAEVRAEVARVLYGLNDRQALQPLLAQLAVEPDAGVRVAIAKALVRVGGLQAVPALVRLLRDPSLPVAIDGARSLADLGKWIKDDAALRDQVAAALVEAMNAPRARDAGGAGGELRAACVEALAPLQDARQQPLFLGLLRLDEPPRVREAALRGLGALGDQNTANRVIDWLGAEPSQLARLAALDALRTVGTFRFAESIYRFTQPAVERDESVRAAAWQTFVGLLPGASKQELAGWADRVARDGRVDQRIPILQVLVTKQLADGEPRDAAYTREQVAESYMQLTPPQPREAVPFYQAARAFWVANNGGAGVVTPLTRSLLAAHLAARQYPEAVVLANDVIGRDRTAAADVAAQIVNEAENLLSNQNLPREAERLATEAQKLWDVPQRFRDRLQEVVTRAARAKPAP